MAGETTLSFLFSVGGQPNSKTTDCWMKQPTPDLDKGEDDDPRRSMDQMEGVTVEDDDGADGDVVVTVQGDGENSQKALKNA